MLVFRYGTLGDTIVAIPALAALRNSCSNRALHYMSAIVPAGRMISPQQILEPTGMIAGFLQYRVGESHLVNWRRVRDYVKRHGIAILFYLPQPERSSALIWRDRGFFAACGIRRLVGFDEALSNARQRARRSYHPDQCECARLLTLVAHCGADPLRKDSLPLGITLSDRDRIDRLWTAWRLHDRCAVVAICPGGKQRCKRWPEERYVQVGLSLLRSFDISLVVVGGPADRLRAQQMCETWGERAFNACGELSVWEAAELLRRCDLYMGNDTGTMHLAALVGTRCLALFSLHNLPGTWFPWGTGHTVVQKRVPCGSCLLEECPKNTPVCIEAITVAEVAAAARRMLLERSLPCVASLESLAT